MTDHPILFSALMIRALLAGTKTQTRRLATSKAMQRVKVGDRLYVREAWWETLAYDDLSPSEMGGEEIIWFAATDKRDLSSGRVRAAMHMPRWASRLTLFCTGTKVERLQDIAEEDAFAEGLVAAHEGFALTKDGEFWGNSAVRSYALLWNSLHSSAGERWDDNPEVIALTFRVEKINIDAKKMLDDNE